jgi:hypothetical protein
MPKAKASQDQPRGTKDERSLFTEVISHYQMAHDDLDVRIKDFDTKDELFRSYIDEDNWPYNSVVFDPRVFTAIFEKTARLFANKPTGRMVPREGGDTLGAKINNELLSYQWDENERVDNQTMLAKWATMDQNTRKYGAGFALVKWRYERKLEKNGKKKGKEQFKAVPFFDGPDFKPLINRDCLANPSYSTIKNWFQYREYTTLQELESVNDSARTKPIYKNLKALRYLGRDEYFRTIEVVTEYRDTRWITFAPKHGVILRDIPNPYDHQQIPVVALKYYPVDDDLYGLSEIEPVEKLQKAINALINQYLDSVNMSLYVPLKIRASQVQMHTIEFGPGKKWIMNDPKTDVVPHESSGKGVNEFASTYRFMIGAMQEALGETSAAVSSLNPGVAEKTATEVKDLAAQRNARDNFNQLYLSEAIKKQMMFWHVLNRQFLFSEEEDKMKVIRIVGRDAIRYFKKRGLDSEELSDETQELLTDPEVAQAAKEVGVDPGELGQPSFPVGMEGEQFNKFVLEEGEEVGHLVITPEDISGNYDYIADVKSMELPNDEKMLATKKQMIEFAKDPATVQLLAQEGAKLNLQELMVDFFEELGTKDASKYFGRIDETNQAGGAAAQGGQPGQGNGIEQGVGRPPEPLARSQERPELPRPIGS